VDYEEDEKYTVPVIQRKFTDAQVNEEAKKQQALQANKEPYTTSRQVMETVQIPETYTVPKRVTTWHEFLGIRIFRTS
jgi:hypothetical protein